MLFECLQPRYAGGMGIKSALRRQRWSRAWKAGGAGVKAVALVFGVLTVPPFFGWAVCEYAAPWLYYPVGLSLHATAALVAVCLAAPFSIVMARATLNEPRITTVFIFLIALFMAYGAAVGVLTVLNGALDSSSPQSHAADVLERSRKLARLEARGFVAERRPTGAVFHATWRVG